MPLPGLPLTASAWLAPMTALAVVAAAAAIILLREQLRLERRSLALQAEVARLSQALREAREAPRLSDGRERAAAAGRSAVAAALSDLTGFRAPLGAIAGMAAMLLDGHLDGEQAIHARRIKALAEYLSGRLAPPLPMVEKAPQGRPRALLAEDDEINGLFAQDALEGAGAEVDWVRNGDDALHAVQASLAGDRPPYDLVCLDIRMPGLNGLDVARRIRALEAAGAHEPPLRIVALTATAMRQDRLAAKAAGFSDFVSKPYRADALAELLSAAPVRLAKAS